MHCLSAISASTTVCLASAAASQDPSEEKPSRHAHCKAASLMEALMQRAAHLLQEMTTPRPRLLEQWRAARTELANAEAALVAFARSCAAKIGAFDLAAHERSEEHTSELQSRGHLVCRLLLEKKNVHPQTLI